MTRFWRVVDVLAVLRQVFALPVQRAEQPAQQRVGAHPAERGPVGEGLEQVVLARGEPCARLAAGRGIGRVVLARDVVPAADEALDVVAAHRQQVEPQEPVVDPPLLGDHRRPGAHDAPDLLVLVQVFLQPALHLVALPGPHLVEAVEQEEDTARSEHPGHPARGYLAPQPVGDELLEVGQVRVRIAAELDEERDRRWLVGRRRLRRLPAEPAQQGALAGPGHAAHHHPAQRRECPIRAHSCARRAACGRLVTHERRREIATLVRVFARHAQRVDPEELELVERLHEEAPGSGPRRLHRDRIQAGSGRHCRRRC
jgi:hypothetical protein